jgi:hypothetical protein
MPRARDFIGRTIVAVDFRQFSDGKGGWAHNPVLVFDNGRKVYFVVEETEVGGYGVEMCLTPRPRKEAAHA